MREAQNPFADGVPCSACGAVIEGAGIVERMHALFELDQETGQLTWRENTRNAGRLAGWVCKSSGYRMVGVSVNGRNRNLRAHHIVWALVHGAWPSLQIDHRNRIRDDNRPSNLREATGAQNQGNVPVKRNSATGIKGVHRRRRHLAKPFKASIRVSGRQTHLGYFATAEEAGAAYAAAAKAHFGEFAKW